MPRNRTHKKAITAKESRGGAPPAGRLLTGVEARDWGIGCAPAPVEDRRFGFQGIGESARLIDGRAVLDSRPGEGTRAFVELLVAAARDLVVIKQG